MLFGPVSISNQYQAVSRELMVTFLERNASLLDWASLISSRNPFKRCSRTPLPSAEGFDLEDLSDCVSDLEPTRTGVPVLLRGLIVVDLTKTEPRLLERYLGKAEAQEFLKHQKGTRSEQHEP